jgi:hypothetical protein
MLGENGIFCGKSFENLFFQEIPRNFPRKKCTKNRSQVSDQFLVSHQLKKQDFFSFLNGAITFF